MCSAETQVDFPRRTPSRRANCDPTHVQLLLRHRDTLMALSCEKDNVEPTDFGAEFEVIHVHVHVDRCWPRCFHVLALVFYGGAVNRPFFCLQVVMFVPFGDDGRAVKNGSCASLTSFRVQDTNIVRFQQRFAQRQLPPTYHSSFSQVCCDNVTTNGKCLQLLSESQGEIDKHTR